jgi:hypothetical protein
MGGLDAERAAQSVSPLRACIDGVHYPGLQSLASLISFTLGARFQRLHFRTRCVRHPGLQCSVLSARAFLIGVPFDPNPDFGFGLGGILEHNNSL